MSKSKMLISGLARRLNSPPSGLQRSKAAWLLPCRTQNQECRSQTGPCGLTRAETRSFSASCRFPVEEPRPPRGSRSSRNSRTTATSWRRSDWMQAERNRCPPCAAKAMATTSRPTASPVKLVSHPAWERHMPAHDDGAHAVRWQPDQGSTTAQPELTKFYRLMKMHEWLANRPMRGSNRMKTIHIATSAKAAELRYQRREGPLPAHHGPRNNRQACRRQQPPEHFGCHTASPFPRFSPCACHGFEHHRMNRRSL